MKRYQSALEEYAQELAKDEEEVLYGMGESLYRLGMIYPSVHYFAEVLDREVSDSKDVYVQTIESLTQIDESYGLSPNQVVSIFSNSQIINKIPNKFHDTFYFHN